ncbi:TolC family protein [bacterium]|nr:TolC family protein [bacterium]
MKQLSFFAMFVLIIVLLPLQAFSEELIEPPLIQQDTPMAVDELIEFALQNQANYQKAVEDERVIGVMKLAAIGSFLPRISADGSFSNNTTKGTQYVGGVPIGVEDQTSSSSSLSFGVSESIFQGFSRLHGMKQAKLTVENTYLNTQRTRDMIVSDVKSYYYNLVASHRYLEVQKEVLEQRREAHRLANARFKTGDVIELDVMQAEIDLGTQQNLVLQAEQGVENAQEALNLAAGLNLDSRFPVVDEFSPVLPELNADTLVRVALESRPDYLALRNTVQINKLAVKRQTANYYPTVSMSYGFGRSETVPGAANKFLLSPDTPGSRLSFNMSWTLFDGFSREYNRQNAVVQARKSMWDSHQQSQQIQTTLRSEWRNLEVLYQQIQVSNKNRDLARRQLQLEQERYRVGASDQLNLRSAQVTFITAEQDYLTKVLDFYTTQATLERDLGTSLDAANR